MTKLFGDKASRISDKLGDSDTLEAFETLNDKLYEFYKELKVCESFRFMEGHQIKKYVDKGLLIDEFWYEINQLLIICIKSSTISLIKILESIAWSYRNRNETTYALVLRTFVEHACAIDDITALAEGRIERYINIVWPSIGSSKVTPGNADFDLRSSLVKFALGCRVRLDENLPGPTDSKKSKQRYLKSIREIPEEIKSKNIMTLIDNTEKRRDIDLLRILYEAMSEYTHPNSASRLFQFEQDHSGKTYSLFDTNEPFTAGFTNVSRIAAVIVPSLSSLTEKNLRILDDARIPMEQLDAKAEQRQGQMKVYDCYGREVWINPKKVRSSNFVRNDLTEDQIVRLKKVHATFNDVDKASFETWLERFQREVDIENELETWEHLACAYNKEVSERIKLSYSERAKIYRIILLASYGLSSDEIVLENPDSATLPFFERVVSRVRKRTPQ